jgi:hypothetical protein
MDAATGAPALSVEVDAAAGFVGRVRLADASFELVG